MVQKEPASGHNIGRAVACYSAKSAKAAFATKHEPPTAADVDPAAAGPSLPFNLQPWFEPNPFRAFNKDITLIHVNLLQEI